ncbi:MAG: F0F1 ATP synthase subunit epsilon [Pseudomonadales bacterium]|jgi:F-type H+-transporting ATPase subunit epsilon|nr:F0F1 ATP synthase subunit epsilon [Pseudomonadales bacterium]
MSMTIHCDIASAEEEIFSGLAEVVSATGQLGEVGIYYGHAPLLTQLKPGVVKVIKQGGEEELYYVSGGFLEVQPGVVTVLADTAVRAKDIDEAAAEAAQKQAEDDMADQSSELDFAMAAARLAQASAQLRTIRQMRNRAG